MKKSLLYTLPLLLAAACSTLDSNDTVKEQDEKQEPVAAVKNTNTNSPYNFSSPLKAYPMPPALREISGLAVMNESTVACIQDEQGSIFIVNLETEEIDKRVVFTGKGDFEEVTLIGDDAFVLESSGAIFHIADYMNEGAAKSNFVETELNKENNAEGMCYDKANKRLLISCKGKGEEKEKNKKAIYAFDLKTQALGKSPVIHLAQSDLKNAIKKINDGKANSKMEKALSSDNIDELFTPSGLAIHPQTGELYVLSTQNNLLAVLDMKGTINKVYTLTHELFTQPEGIAFAANGDMYISNEGQKGMGNILKFSYEKK